MIRNDTNLHIAEALKVLEGGPMLTYGGVSMQVPMAALDDARKQVAATTPEDRTRIMFSVNRALQKALPKMLRDDFKKKTADNFCNDLLLWTALKETQS